MPPQIAAALTYAFVFWLFFRDIREKPNITRALWIPLLWFLILTTRNVSQWLFLLGFPGFRGSTLEEGNTLDASVFLTLIIAGVCVLSARRIRLAEFLRENPWLVVFLLYCSIAIAWSDFPYSAFKRWIKVIGHPVMGLIV